MSGVVAFLVSIAGRFSPFFFCCVLFYQGPKVAVQGLSFSVSTGDCFGFLGINGAGELEFFIHASEVYPLLLLWEELLVSPRDSDDKVFQCLMFVQEEAQLALLKYLASSRCVTCVVAVLRRASFTDAM